MSADKELEKEVLTRLLHAHPAGLGKEILDNYRGENAVAETITELQARGLIQDRKADSNLNTDPIKLTASGVEAAKHAQP